MRLIDHGITFEPKAHVYTDRNGKVVPSVTQILKRKSDALYAGVPQSQMKKAAALGTAVHKVVELDIKQNLDEARLDPDLRKYLDAWRRFLDESGFFPVLSETLVYSPTFKFAGTLDLFGEMNDRLCVLDVKRVDQVPSTFAFQTAAYAQALKETIDDMPSVTGRHFHRYALQLKSDGRYQLHKADGASDLGTFLNELNVYKKANK